jgi:hypothetical protein
VTALKAAATKKGQALAKKVLAIWESLHKRKSAAQKAAVTRKRRAAGKKAATTKRPRTAAQKAAATRRRELRSKADSTQH